MSTRALTLFVALVALTGCAKSQSLTQQVETTLPSVVHLTAFNEKNEELWTGSGAVIGDGKTVMTAKHCVTTTSELPKDFGKLHHFVLRMSDGKKITVAVDKPWKSKRDLAFIPIDKRYPALKFAAKNAPVGTLVYALGYPQYFMDTPVLQVGWITTYTEMDLDPGIKSAYFSAPTTFGNSGGAICNEQAEVVALVNTRQMDHEHYNSGLPVAFIRSEWQAYSKR